MHRGPARAIAARVLGGLLLCSAPGLAEEPTSPSTPSENKWLDWSAPAECPGADQIQQRLKEWLKAPLKPQHELKVVASAQSQKGLWLVSVDFSYGSDQGKRQVSLETCSEGADFVALTVALAVDPELQLRDESDGGAAIASSSVVAPSEQDEAPGETAAAAEQIDSAAENEGDRVDAEESESSADDASLAPVDRRDRRAPRVSSSKASALTLGKGGQAPLPELHFLLGAGLLGFSGSLPAFALGPILTLGWRSDRFLVEASAFYLPGAAYSFDNWDGQSRMRTTGADLRACYQLIKDALRGGPCGGMQAGAVMAREVLPTDASEANKGSALLLSALLGASGQYAFTRSLAGSLGVFAQIPLVKPQFELSEGTLVFQSSAGIVLDLGLRTFF